MKYFFLRLLPAVCFMALGIYLAGAGIALLDDRPPGPFEPFLYAPLWFSLLSIAWAVLLLLPAGRAKNTLKWLAPAGFGLSYLLLALLDKAERPYVYECLAIAAGGAAAMLLHRRASGQRVWVWSLGNSLSDLWFGGALAGLFFALLALTGRPALAAAPALGLVVALYFLNAAKISALREPLLVTDLYMLRHLIFFPRFYFPYIPATPFVLAGLLAAALVVMVVESGYSPMFVGATWRWEAGILAAIQFLAFLCSRRFLATIARRPPTFDPAADAAAYGLAGLALVYATWRRVRGHRAVAAAAPRPDGLAAACVWPAASAPAPARGEENPVPHIVLVQAESFFRLPRLAPGIGADWTRRFDELAAAPGALSGLLEVSGYGAYTVRTEFGALTGVAPASLGVHRFNPYSLAARHEVGGLPRHLAGLGYDTLCIHPGDLAFLDRDRVLPHLGFARRLGQPDFAGAERIGPYVADRAVAARVAEELRASRRPLFIFAITIEAHGPWGKGRLAGVPPLPPNAGPLPEALLADDPDGGLAAYARHLRHADEALGLLADLAPALDRPLAIGFYGDHIGSLPRGVQLSGPAPAATDFLIWRGHPLREDQPAERAAPPLPAEALGGLVLQLAMSNEQ